MLLALVGRNWVPTNGGLGSSRTQFLPMKPKWLASVGRNLVSSDGSFGVSRNSVATDSVHML